MGEVTRNVKNYSEDLKKKKPQQNNAVVIEGW